MPDFNAPFGGDLSLSPTGGLELIDGLALTQQRLIRRLMTNPGDYIWEPTYGAGLPRFVGRPMQAQAIAAIVQAQAAQEETIASVTSVAVSQVAIDAYGLTITFVAAAAGAAQVLTFTVTASGVTAA